MSIELPKCKSLSPGQVASLLEDVRAGMTAGEAVEKYGAAKTTMQRLLDKQGLRFVRRLRTSDDEIRAAIATGMSLLDVARTLKVRTDRVRNLQRDMGVPTIREIRSSAKDTLTGRCLELAATHTTAEIATTLGVAPRTVRRHLSTHGVVAVQKVARPKPVKAATPTVRIPRTPKPAPIKRPKRPTRRAPLFDYCQRKHAITPSNRVQGTEKECLVCRKRGINVSPALAGRRDAMIADLLRVIEKEVAELTAKLRPEMKEKAA